MKKSLLLALIALSTGLLACNSNNENKERQDSLEAAAAADSMLRDATQEADTTVTVDSVVVDTTPKQNP
jgi:hypothetical protein